MNPLLNSGAVLERRAGAGGDSLCATRTWFRRGGICVGRQTSSSPISLPIMRIAPNDYLNGVDAKRCLEGINHDGFLQSSICV